MTDNSILKFAQPGIFTDSLTEILRNGACALLAQAVEVEVVDFLAKHGDLKTAAGCQRVVLHGHLPEARDHDGHRAGRRATAARA